VSKSVLNFHLDLVLHVMLDRTFNDIRALIMIENPSLFNNSTVINWALDDRLQKICDEAVRIVDSASKSEVNARLIGGVGVRLHTRKYAELFERLGRSPGDIDLVSRKNHSDQIGNIMKSFGYSPAERFNTYHGHKRQLWYAKTHQIDIIFDVLEMNHRVDFRDRLKLDFPTVTPADLLLTKLQVVNLNKKDIQDMVILLLEHDAVLDERADTIDLSYLGKVLCSEWGFWYTANRNLCRIEEFVLNASELTTAEKDTVNERTRRITLYLDSIPKSLSFRMREAIGTRKQWYNDVEEVVR